MKKILLSSFVAAVMLSGCGGGGGSDTTTSSQAKEEPVSLQLVASEKNLSAGGQHAHFTKNGITYTWGDNFSGQLGISSKYEGLNTNSPLILSGVTSKIVSISSGVASSVALDEQGRLWSWGLNEHGQLGINSLTYEFLSPQPINMELFNQGKVVKIASGDANVIAQDVNGRLFSWGWNGYGQIGDGSKGPTIGRNGDKLIPTQVKINLPSGVYVTDFTSGWASSIALDSSGSVWAWGYNFHGELGDGKGANGVFELLPVKVDLSSLNGAKPLEIESGRYHTLLKDSNGKLWVWGWNNVGQLGTGDTQNELAPRLIEFNKPIDLIAAGAQHSLALDSDGVLWAWGNNQNYQLGDGTRRGSRSPVKVNIDALVGRKIVSIAAGNDYSILVDDQNDVWAWGNNLRGQVGKPAEVYYPLPVKVNIPN